MTSTYDDAIDLSVITRHTRCSFSQTKGNRSATEGGKGEYTKLLDGPTNRPTKMTRAIPSRESVAGSGESAIILTTGVIRPLFAVPTPARARPRVHTWIFRRSFALSSVQGAYRDNAHETRQFAIASTGTIANFPLSSRRGSSLSPCMHRRKKKSAVSPTIRIC